VGAVSPLAISSPEPITSITAASGVIRLRTSGNQAVTPGGRYSADLVGSKSAILWLKALVVGYVKMITVMNNPITVNNGLRVYWFIFAPILSGVRGVAPFYIGNNTTFFKRDFHANWL
jgi:hypothetical protein